MKQHHDQGEQYDTGEHTRSNGTHLEDVGCVDCSANFGNELTVMLM